MTHVLLLPLALLATTPIDEEQDWPRTFTTEKGTASVYTPQLELLKGDQLTARAAVSWEPSSGGDSVFGVAFFTAAIDVDRDERLVTVRSVKVTKLRFPNVTPEKETKYSELLGAEMSKWDLSFSLDTMLASLEVAERERSTPGIKSTPPKILIATEPTVLVTIDGEPKLTKVEGTSLERVINTQFLLVHDPDDKRFFITSGAAWFAASAVKGPWAPVDAPSKAVLEWYSKNPPPPPPEDEPPATPPVFVVATEPTELLQFDGKPAWTPIVGVGLLAASNTDSDVFIELSSQKVYLLLAGRWFTAKKLEGPWTVVGNDKLPRDFANIPADSGEGHVLAFVAGTPQAKDALADTQVPTTSTVRKDAGKDLVVTWDGEPKFKAIEGTKLSYGVNTKFSVLLVEGKYWVCHQAVWYLGPSPKGPWTVAESRPPGLDALPASAPVYNVKYVYVYDVQPDVVVVGYLPGYVGVYPYHGCVVYGTGWYYPPYVTPYYYAPRPPTWGVHVTWNPWMGFGVGISYGTPYFRIGIHFGGYPGYWGPVGYRPIPPPYYRPGYPPPGHRPVPGYPPGHRPATGTPRPPSGGVPPGGWGGMGGARPSQPIAGQPGAGGPRPSQPIAGQPGAGGPRPSQPIAGQPGAGGPRPSQPIAGQPGGGPSASQPIAGQPGAGGARPGQQPGTGGPGASQPIAGQQPGAGGARPGQQPGAGAPGASQPIAGQPGGGFSGASPGQQPSNIYQRGDNASRNASRPAQQPVAPSSVGGRPNDVYGGANGDVYRKGNQGWEQRQGGGWSSPSQQPAARPSSPAPSQNLNRDYSARQRGGGSYGGGGMRGGGGGRRR